MVAHPTVTVRVPLIKFLRIELNINPKPFKGMKLFMQSEKIVGRCKNSNPLPMSEHLKFRSFALSKPLKKGILIMKLTGILLLVACMHVSASVYSQQVTLNEKNASLETVLKTIRKQTGYTLLYSNEVINKAQPVTVNFNKTALNTALDQLFDGQPLTYSIDDKTILIKEKDPTILDKIKSVFTASSANVSGIVADSLSSPLVGATVVLENTNYKAITDEEGKFNFSKVPNGKYVLLVTYIGYKRFELSFEVAGIDVTLSRLVMHTENGQLKEVIVSNGYQALPLERSTGAYDHIDNDLLNRSTSPNILDHLNGVASGLLTTNTNGINNSGNDLGINIRGLSTINSNTTPLIILDNFPYDGDINNINPNDIESVTILKDAAASSIWGAQAGNGVIVITSKKGHLNQPIKVELNSNVTLSQKPNLDYNRNFLDANDYINVEQQLYANGFYNGYLNQTGYPVAVSPVVDLLNQESNGTITASQANSQINALRNVDVRNDLSKYFYQSPVDQQYNLNLSGGSNKATYFFSAGYDNDPSIQVGSGSQRITLNSQNTFTPIKNLDITAGLNYTQSRQQTDNTLSQVLGGSQAYQSGGQFFPYTQLADANGNPLPITDKYLTEFVDAAPGSGYLNWQFVPLQELRDHDNATTTNNYDIRANVGLNYTIIPGLVAEAKYQYERQLTNSLQDATQQSFYTRDLINQFSNVNANGQVTGYNVPVGDILQYGYTNLVSQDLRLQLNYNKEWKSNSLSLLGGYEVRDVPTTFNAYAEYGYNPTNTTFSPVDAVSYFTTNPLQGYNAINSGIGNNQTDNRYRSYFANAGYTYNGKYTISASGRIDQSNLFGVNTNQKTNPLWSAGFKWDLDKEAFYHIDWLNSLKARVTYGFSGNINTNVTAYPTFSFSSSQSYYGTIPSAQLGTPGDPDLTWEKIGQLNLAIDFGLFNNSITGSFDYYSKSGTDLIGPTIFPASAGLSSGAGTALGNYSDMKGRGIDLTLNTRNINGKFRWDTQLLFNYTTDEITKYTGTGGGLEGGTVVIGKPVEGLYALKWAGLDLANGNPRGYLNGQISENYSALVSQPMTNPGNVFNTNSSWAYIGSATPTVSGGIRNTFSYQSFSISANIVFQGGFYFRKNSISYTGLFNQGIGNIDFTKRWQYPGDNTSVPSMPSLNNLDPNRDVFYDDSQVLVDNGNNIRFQDINFSYNITQRQWHQLPFDHVTIYLYANNLGLIWTANKDHLDPEYGSTGIPQPRIISLGLKAGF